MTRLPWILVALVLGNTLIACTRGDRRMPSRIVSDHLGACPMRDFDSPYEPGLPPDCAVNRRGNAVGGIFRRPRGPWGVAYAFTCGARPHPFAWHLNFAGADSIILHTGVDRHERSGRGYQMPARAVAASIGAGQLVPALDIEIQSACTWHFRVVAGDSAAVAAAIPQIPRYRWVLRSRER